AIAVVRHLRPLTGQELPEGAKTSLSEGRGEYQPAGDGLERWITVHHAYFLLNLHAACSVRAATAALAQGDETTAVDLLREACVYVHGFTAAMVHAAAVSSAYYRAVVRPTMQPPAVSLLLTGGMQPEHASYRLAIKQLLRSAGEPFVSLVRTRRPLAEARDA